MNIGEEKVGGVLVLKPESRIDSQNSKDFEDGVLSRTDNEKSILLDFSDVEYISSACLRTLLTLTKKIKEQGGNIAITSLTKNVKQIFKVSGFDTILQLFEDKDEAVKSF
ncbi:MAG: anti-sigma factor antagonist [Deltaproteobacteria bacterium]|nr:MAG: anti-sigma factor antagonist [Deltaproteobacteria bacterium]